MEVSPSSLARASARISVSEITSCSFYADGLALTTTSRNECWPHRTLQERISPPSQHAQCPEWCSYIGEKPVLDISAAAANPAQKNEYSQVDITQGWPPPPTDSLDETQWEALQQILTHRLAVVQGPPGTGKTHVSKIALEILHANRKPDDTPIIIAAQTNHALDQLLEHVSHFEPNYIRLGGRSTNSEVKKRALFEIRQAERIRPIPGGLSGKTKYLRTKQTKGLTELLEPFAKAGSDPWSTDQVSGPKTLHKLGVLTAQQAQSLEDGATQWVSSNPIDGPLRLWLEKALVPFQVDYVKENFGFEEADDDDLEFEQLKENEDSHGVNDEEDIEMLKGDWCEIHDRFTVQEPSAADLGRAAKFLDTVTDMWKIPDYYRAHVYHMMQSRAKAKIAAKFREDAKVYDKLVKDDLIGKWEQDAVYLQRASIIGMTTTGLSKYRALISALKPKVILIEEAAEVLEAPVTVACIETLEHLILVGDHQQLQGHCSVQELENEPFFLNVSLFERLVKNNMSFKTLSQQRRMMPEFRGLIADIYPNLTDHQSVVDRRLGSWGTGNIRSFFFDHEWWEAKDDSLSTFNPEEAKFIAGFYRYLVRNDTDPSRITVLTFYNGQRKRLLRELKEFPELRTYVNVKTVDSYQGEENDIVILSLARRNQEGKIGFLDNVNRVCVALSRAKYGFYLFGNSDILMRQSPLWFQVLTLMESSPKRRGDVLPIMCKRHGRTTLMRYPADWEKTDGGCMNPCATALNCGHTCQLQCHPFSHDNVQCAEDCGKTLPCGHGCSEKCGQACLCSCEEFARLKQAELMEHVKSEAPADARQSVWDTPKNGQEPPSSGSASHLPKQASTLIDGNWQVIRTADWGPEEGTYSNDRRSARNGYRIGATSSSAQQNPLHANSISHAEQTQLQKGWKDYAHGGFAVQDVRLLLNSENKAQFNWQASGIKEEAVQLMSNGKTKVQHEYRPGSHPADNNIKQVEEPETTTKTNIGTSLKSKKPVHVTACRPAASQNARAFAESVPPAPKLMSSGNNEGSAMEDLKVLNGFFQDA